MEVRIFSRYKIGTRTARYGRIVLESVRLIKPSSSKSTLQTLYTFPCTHEITTSHHQAGVNTHLHTLTPPCIPYKVPPSTDLECSPNPFRPIANCEAQRTLVLLSRFCAVVVIARVRRKQSEFVGLLSPKCCRASKIFPIGLARMK